jgi:hypothetical protein
MTLSFNSFFQGQCYKTFYGRNLSISVTSYSVCPWQAFPAKSNVCEQGQEPKVEWGTRKVFHLNRLLPYLQTLYYHGKAYNAQTRWLITKISKLQP